MDVIIPLAGKGTRLRPHTYSKPKPLISVAGKPMLGHILDKLDMLDLDKVILITGDMDDQIKDYVKANYKYDFEYVKQLELLGDGHAVNLAKDLVKDDVLVIFSDTLFITDLKKDLKQQEDIDAIVWTKKTNDPKRFGIVTLKEGMIVDIEEKPQHPKSDLAVVGMYYFKKKKLLFDYLQQVIDTKRNSKGEYRIADALKLMIEDNKKISAPTLQEWLDCGKPETLLETNQYLLKNGHSNDAVTVNTIIIPPVFIDPEAHIANSIIGPNVSIAKGAVIEFSIIKNTIISKNATLKHVTLKNSLIGDESMISGAEKTVNIGDNSQFSNID